MSIEGSSLANSFANAAASNAYNDTLSMRDTSGVAMDDVNAFQAELAHASQVTNVASQNPKNAMDEVLTSLQRMSNTQADSVKGIMEAFEAIEAPGSLNMVDALNLQVKVHEFQLVNELIAKSADRVSQGAQTLFRNQ